MQTLRKHLLYQYVPIMGKTFGSGARESCIAHRSIYVMLSGKEEIRRHINQVRYVLTYLLPAKMYKCLVIGGIFFEIIYTFVIF
jgi:hypothetical protein